VRKKTSIPKSTRLGSFKITGKFWGVPVIFRHPTGETRTEGEENDILLNFYQRLPFFFRVLHDKSMSKLVPQASKIRNPSKILFAHFCTMILAAIKSGEVGPSDL
jgi:hypothetical protein